MSRLLRADFACLWKNRSFWLCMAYVVVASYFMAEIETLPEGVFPDGTIYIIMLFFIFICNIIGSDFSDGTIRNKVAAGHSRGAIFFSEFFVCASASVILYVLFVILIAVVSAARPWWKFEMPVEEIALIFSYCFVAVISYTALFVLIGMLVGNRSEGLVISVLLTVLLFVLSVQTDVSLEEPEYITKEYITTESESVVIEEGGEEVKHVEFVEEKNPFYVGGVKRQVYEFVNDFLPFCQIYSISSDYRTQQDDADAGGEMSGDGQQVVKRITPLLCSLLFIVLMVSGGTFFFRRKNIR